MISFVEACVVAVLITAVCIAVAYRLGRRSGIGFNLDELEAHRAKLSKLQDEVNQNIALVSEMSERAPVIIEQLSGKVRDYERRWMNAQDAVEVFQKQRDEWRDRFREQAMLHLAGQQQIETNLIAARTMFKRLADQWQAERKKAGQPALTIEPKELLAPPVGAAAAYFESIKQLLLGAPAEFDAIIAAKRVNEEDFDAELAKAIVAVRLADGRPATGMPPQHEHIAPKLEEAS